MSLTFIITDTNGAVLSNPANAVKCLERSLCDKIKTRMGQRICKDGIVQRRHFRREIIDHESFNTRKCLNGLIFRLNIAADEADAYMKRFRVKIDDELIVGLSESSSISIWKDPIQYGVKLVGLKSYHFSSKLLDIEISEMCGVIPTEYERVNDSPDSLICIFGNSEAARTLCEFGDIDIGTDIVKCELIELPMLDHSHRQCYLCGDRTHISRNCHCKSKCHWCGKSDCKIATCSVRLNRKPPKCCVCNGRHTMGSRTCPFTARIVRPPRRNVKKSDALSAEQSKQPTKAVPRVSDESKSNELFLDTSDLKTSDEIHTQRMRTMKSESMKSDSDTNSDTDSDNSDMTSSMGKTKRRKRNNSERSPTKSVIPTNLQTSVKKVKTSDSLNISKSNHV